MRHKNKWLFVITAALLTSAAYAQVTLDGTVGQAGALPGPNYAITADLGRQVGGNLFHSFSQFSINTGESATFSGPNSVSNIIGRVTGGRMSLIDGAIRSTIPGANLYLLNPAGVLFGENATLDVPGSVHVSTADYLRLSDSGRFDARTPGNSVLTVAPVAAFGFLSDAPGKIEINGSFLQAPEGQTLSLIGGDINLSNATLYAPAGQINLAAVGSVGEVVPTEADLAMQGFSRLGAISMERTAAERQKIGDVELGDVDASGQGGGAIFIRGGQWISRSGMVVANTFGDRNGRGVNVAIRDEMRFEGGALLITETYGSGRAGSVTLDVGRLELSGESYLFSGAYGAGDAGAITVNARHLLVDGQGSEASTGIASSPLAGSTGAGGDMQITVADTLSVINGGVIFAGTFGAGRSGAITVSARNLLIDGQGLDTTGISSAAYPGSTGAGGNITISVADTLSIANSGNISAGAFAAGNAGAITVNAGDLVIDGQGSTALTGLTSGAYPDSTGAGGAVNINVANTLSLVNGGSISTGTFSVGNAGAITVSAGNLIADGQGSAAFTGVSSSAYRGSAGAGGGITLTIADALSLVNGGGIIAGTFGPGAGGRINVSVGGAVTVAGIGATGFPSRLLVSAEGTGQAGDLSLFAPRLTITDGGGIFATSMLTSGGNLLVNADHLKLLDGGQISTSVFGDPTTQGGNIEINSINFVALNGSQVTATATEGLGGRITVNADVFLHDAASVDQVLNASSQVIGNDGVVQNNAPTTDISASLTTLPVDYLDAAGQLSRRCGEGDSDKRSRFTVQGRGGLPPAPDELLSARTGPCPPPSTPQIGHVISRKL